MEIGKKITSIVISVFVKYGVNVTQKKEGGLDMKEIENYLIVANEECAEISKEICKSLRFGLDNKYPEHARTNAEKILTEFYQLSALIETLQDHKALPILSEAKVKNIKSKKLAAVKEWYETKKEKTDVSE